MRRNILSHAVRSLSYYASPLNSTHFLATAILILFLTATSPVSAQYRAGLQGAVTDSTGAVVPGAKVTLTSKETNLTKTTTSSDSGVYSISSLAPGRYSLTIEKEGFAKKTVDDVLVGAEQTTGLNVEIEVGQAQQSVTVSADTLPDVETQTATIGGTITSRDVQQLPSFSRDPFRLMQLAPGSFGDNARAANGDSFNLPGNAGPGGSTGSLSIFQTENQVQISANGLRTNSNSYQVDGVSVNSLAWGGAAVVTPNEESVKEVRVDSNAYSAENGRAGGAQVLVVSKNGTNSFHGSALLRVARPGLNAYQRWNGPASEHPGTPQERGLLRNTDRFNQWAGSIGGPIIKNRLFFFFSYETLRLGTVATGTGTWYETPQFLSAVQASKPNSIGAKIAGFPGEGVSSQAILQRTCADAGISNPSLCQTVNGGLDLGSPLATPLGTPDPGFVNATNFGNGSGLDGIPDVFFVSTSNPNTRTAQQFNGRVDFQATASDLIAFSMYHVPVDSTFFNGPVRAANLWNNTRTNQSGTVLWNHTFSGSLLNEARVSASRWHWNEVESNPQEPFGLPQAKVDDLSGVTISGQFLGPPGPSIFNQTTYNFRDTLTWMRGAHALKFGADIYWEQNNDNQVFAARPSYQFHNLWDFANDAPYLETGNFDPRTGQPTSVRKDIRSKIYAFFVQDDFKVRPNLTLNLGLRWEYFGPITEKNGQISNAILGSGTNTLTDLRLKLGGNLYDSSKNNFGPQIGFAWTPWVNRSNFVLRGGFGIGYTRMDEGITLNGRVNPPFVSNANLTGTDVLYAVPDDVHQFNNWPVNPVTIQTFDPVTNLPTTGTVALQIFPQELQTPITYRYSLDTQYELPGNWVATLGYQGSTTRHYTRQQNLSTEFPRNPALSQVNFYSNDVNANFNALLAGVRHNFSRSFQFSGEYRWSKAIDAGTNEFFFDLYPFDQNFQRGPSDFDVRHNVKLFGIWSPRFFASNSWKDKILGGWDISGVFNWHSGFPWSPIYSPVGCNLVITGSGLCNLLPASFTGGAGTSQSNDTFMKPNGNFPGGALNFFTIPVFTTDGTIPPPPGVGRNSLYGPHYLNVDMGLQKSFGLPKLPALGENARFEFRADFFNIFNKLNLKPDSIIKQISQDGVTSTPNFAQAQSALTGRVINLQARFSF